MRSGRGAWRRRCLAAAMLLAGGAARADVGDVRDPDHPRQPGGGQRHRRSTPRSTCCEPYLSKPPFTAWHEFKLLDRKVLTLTEQRRGSSSRCRTGAPATLTFLGHTGGPGEHRMRLRLFIDHREKKHRVLDTTFVLDEGGVVLHVGTEHEGGVLILGVSCKTQRLDPFSCYS